jgi:hypothetical protein
MRGCVSEIFILCSIEDLCPLLNASNTFPLSADICHWAAMTIEQKLAFYHKQACHELHLFLRAHDPVFFTSHVAPAISNRLDLDFMDLLMLGRDVSDFAAIARCASLNVCEQILLAQAIGGQIGAGIALDVVRRCSALDVPKQEWKDSVRLNAAMSYGVFSRGISEETETEESTVCVGITRAPRGGGGGGVSRSGVGSSASNFLHPPPAPSAAAPVMYQSAGKVKHIIEKRWNEIPQPSVFFRDLAMHTSSRISGHSNAPFLPPSISTACNCALVALSFISLPLSVSDGAAVKLQRRVQSGISALYLVASGVCIRYFKDTSAIAPPPTTRVVIVGQHILESVFDPAVGWKMATVAEQGCLIGRPYALRTIITNVTEKDLVVNVLTQIPLSSMPLYGALHTNVKKIKLSSFSVKVVDNWFFFPVPGSVSVYPAQVASASGECIGCAVPIQNLLVISSLSVSASSSWPVIVSHGTEEQVLAALTSDMNLLRMRVVHVLGRMAQSTTLLLAVFKILRQNSVCIPVVWALGLAASVRDAAVEFLIDILPPTTLASLVGSSIPLPASLLSQSCARKFSTVQAIRSGSVILSPCSTLAHTLSAATAALRSRRCARTTAASCGK